MSKVTPIGSGMEVRHPPKSHSHMDTVLIEMRTIAGWKLPPFQRQLRVNEKVRQISEEIRKQGGIIPGVITIGRLVSGRDAGEYLIDGQHRVEAFRLSECREAIADIRMVDFENMAAMGEEFVRLNSPIVRLRPDDVLRGLEGSTPVLQHIRERCPFVGYDQIRRSPTSALVSMSSVLRVWAGAGAPTPVAVTKSAVHLASELSEESAAKLCIYLNLSFSAWGLDENSKRLWGSLNLGITMWMWCKLVDDTSRTTNRYIVLKNDTFKRCLMSLGANETYNDWLLGRVMGDRDRPACYMRIREIFRRRILEDKVTHKPQFPSPAWTKGN